MFAYKVHHSKIDVEIAMYRYNTRDDIPTGPLTASQQSYILLLHQRNGAGFITDPEGEGGKPNKN